MEWYLKVMRQYAEFNGRARRQEFWMFTLFNLLFFIAALIVDSMIGFPILIVLYALAVFIPKLAVTVRRLHDTDKSGWMVLISFIPLIGTIWLLILLITEGDHGENLYGPDPKADDFID